MSNRVARSIVAVPALLLGSVFMATGFWLQDEATGNRSLALFIGSLLILTALLLVLWPMAARK